MSFWAIAAIVLLGAAAFIAWLWVLGSRTAQRGPPCPSCGDRLRLVEWLRWSGQKDGERPGGATSYYRCDGCDGRFCQEIKGEVRAVGKGDRWPDTEWVPPDSSREERL